MQRDYYVWTRAPSERHPLLAWAQSSLAFRQGREVDTGEVVQLRLGEPMPSLPVMVDCHTLPAPVVSARLADVLRSVPLPGVQLIPADVQVGEGDVRRYTLVHMWRRLPVMDRERSVYRLAGSGVVLTGLDRLVLDESVLRDVPLGERLAFRLKEAVVHLVHASLVERVLGLSPPPEGLRFIPLEAWDDSVAFR
ncbi:hypothetical protein HUA74_07135 [Myxococcus sp. CA051A]|uniref:imm11 family protein n=1 Tax=Myxococcus sp. CA051A TaxID=2741739 RepID=UPI00157AD966|nr:hypothetical protein [Myxococcus sp. CA051A]NTX60431.1 hypothetical protein [Myxococcus sp. CA051A]